jgi:uncharacterized protein YqgC (DUF456 family)
MFLLATFLLLMMLAVTFSVAPVLPGPPFAVVAMILIPTWPWHGFVADDFTWWVAMGTAVLGLIITIIDFASPVLAKLFEGALGKSSRAAAFGSVFGLFGGLMLSVLAGCFGIAAPFLAILPVPIMMVTPFLGAMMGEYFHKVEVLETGKETLSRCARSALVQWLGLLTTIMLKVGYCLLTIPIGVWLIIRMIR